MAIQEWLSKGTGEGELLARLTGLVARATRRHPPFYFEMGERSDAAIDSLAHRLFTLCSRVTKTRHPYGGRTPFRTFADDGMDDRTILRHLAWGRMSLLHELMREDFDRNLTRAPELRWRETLYDCVRLASRVVSPVRESRSDDAVVAALARSDAEALDERARLAWRLGGHRRSVAQVTDLLLRATPHPADAPPPDADPEDIDRRLYVRAAVEAVWATLDPEQRTLVLSTANGTALEPTGADDAVRTSRALKRVGLLFACAIAGGGAPEPEMGPAALVELVAALVIQMHPELAPTPTAPLRAARAPARRSPGAIGAWASFGPILRTGGGAPVPR